MLVVDVAEDRIPSVGGALPFTLLSLSERPSPKWGSGETPMRCSDPDVNWHGDGFVGHTRRSWFTFEEAALCLF